MSGHTPWRYVRRQHSKEPHPGGQDIELFNKYGLRCGTHACRLIDWRKSSDRPFYICKGDKVYKRVGETLQYQEMT